MKGAIAELWASTTSAPSRKRVTSIGNNHQRLFCQKKENNSPAMPTLRAALPTSLIKVPPGGELLSAGSRALEVFSAGHPHCWIADFRPESLEIPHPPTKG